MKLLTYPLGDLSTNCYILIDENSGDAIAIDIGGDEGFLLMEEIKNGFKIKAVLLTHAHFDHIGGVYKFFERGADVYIGSLDEKGVLDGSLNLSSVFGSDVKPFKVKTALLGGEVLKFGDIDVEVISTPGHTVGGVSYKVQNMIFCGDTLFDGSFGRIDFPGGNVVELCNSAKKLLSYDGCVLYPGHGGATTVEKERKSNPINGYIKHYL
jgi:glyoxylase-like metal-dependent hydrolase (beta-lactamase superfamily II)